MQRVIVFLLCSLFLFFSGLVNAAAPHKTWTFLVYLNGNNNLDSFGLENIKQMEEIGSGDQVNIVVQWASMSAEKTVRLLVLRNPASAKKGEGIYSPIVQDLGNVDMGDVHTLDDFVKWGVENYPADHYFVNVWNHGMGWHSLRAKRFAKSDLQSMDISWDDNTGHFISTEQFGRSMERAAKIIGHKVDIVGCDACLMAMAEVVNEMSDYVGVFVGSQEVEPGAGWPYSVFLKHWVATPNATAAQVATYLVNDYVESYSDDVTMSAFDLGKIQVVDSAVADLGAALRQLNAADRANVFEQAKSARRFFSNDYVDLIDFTRKVEELNIRSMDANVLTHVKTAVNDFIIANADSPSYSKATGLSIWLPGEHLTFDVNKGRYKGLKFTVATQWNDTLEALLQGSGRNKK